MAKDFFESFREWANDDRYAIGEDIGWEFSDSLESDPMSEERSLTQEDGPTPPTQEILDPGKAT